MAEYHIPVGRWTEKVGVDFSDIDFDNIDRKPNRRNRFSNIVLDWKDFESASQTKDIGHVWWELEAEGDTLINVFQDIEKQYPGTLNDLLDSRTGKLRTDLCIFINGENVHDFNTDLPDDAEIYILHAIAGG